MNTFLLIVYYSLNATSYTAMLTGPIETDVCTEMAAIGHDAEHITTCGDPDYMAKMLALHDCALDSVDVGIPETREYTCQK